jgi:hypothetical protein
MVENPVNITPPLGTQTAAERKQRQIIIVASIAAEAILILVIAAIIYLMQPGTATDKIRDIFIIFMALESLVIGAALVVLVVQIASLINLLNNEIKPMLESTNETIATLRGTTIFLSENVVEPVVKLNSYVAGLQKMVDIFSIKK